MTLLFHHGTGQWIQDNAPETAEDSNGRTCYVGSLEETDTELGHYYVNQDGGECGLYYNCITDELETY